MPHPSKKWLLAPPALDLDEDYQIKLRGYYWQHSIYHTDYSQRIITSIIDLNYPTVEAEHDFVATANCGQEDRPYIPAGEYTCSRCGLKAIRNEKNHSFSLHSQSWSEELNGTETCNELLMRRVLG